MCEAKRKGGLEAPAEELPEHGQTMLGRCLHV